MGHHHDHDNAPPHRHSHSDAPPDLSGLKRTLFLAGGYMLAEVIGGLMSGSLALLADAGHMLSDVAALVLTLVAFHVGQRPPTARRTYGFRRVEVLAALANGLLLTVIAIFILVEARERFSHPHEIRGGLMLGVAIGGLVVNLLGLMFLHGDHNHSLNMRGAFLHVMADTLGSVGALVSAGLILQFGWLRADAVASCLIACLIVGSAFVLLRDTVNVLLESVPSHIDAEEVRLCLMEPDGVLDIHDLHIWTLTGGKALLTAHLAVAQSTDDQALLAELGAVLEERFGIDHSTLQIEKGHLGEHGQCEAVSSGVFKAVEESAGPGTADAEPDPVKAEVARESGSS